MTSASELFHTRRYRWNRNDSELGLDSVAPDRHLQYHRRHHGHIGNHRRDSNACGGFRRSSLQERPQSPRFSHPLVLDHSTTRSDSATSQASRSNTYGNIWNSSRRAGTGLRENSRLPGDVLLARERLLERLRGAPSPTSRNGASLVEASDRSPETSPSRSPRSSLIDTTFQIDRLRRVPDIRKSPPGLSLEAIDCLQQLEFLTTTEHVDGDELTMKAAPSECSICLESFISREKLIHLPCEHKFHFTCLLPWIRTRGDCPYCRRHIIDN